jgi:hypothetical protein
VPDDGEVATAALYRDDGATVHVLQATAPDQAAATEVLLAAAGHERALRFANAPPRRRSRRRYSDSGPTGWSARDAPVAQLTSGTRSRITPA